MSIHDDRIEEIKELIGGKVGPAGAFMSLSLARNAVRELLNEREELLGGLERIKDIAKKRATEDMEEEARKKFRKIRKIVRLRLKERSASNGDNNSVVVSVRL